MVFNARDREMGGRGWELEIDCIQGCGGVVGLDVGEEGDAYLTEPACDQYIFVVE